ncbi:hypothetical protein RirG_108930 [Rhizophagus irregularis DAOM 197198w]|uniref:Uncharacterized protein n=1 Tax=Rhizophagus irregularis (strain DAOM 197198w) TaxID=1432141 RepID=A0A015MMG4_RHIIW|nr:hypothetical protein RirG_108930 [Rhizophagus irregularis DAOM 197198w]
MSSFLQQQQQHHQIYSMSNETNEDTNDTNEGDNAKDDTNDTNKGDNAKDEDDDDNDKIDKEFGYKNLIINCSSDFIRIGKNSGGAIEVNLNNQWDTKMDHYPAQGGRKGHSFSTATSKFMAQGGCERRNFSNTSSKLTNIGKFTIHKELSISCMKMGESLFTLLQHIHKLSTPPPIADTLQICDHDQYRVVLLRHLSRINNVNEFCNSSIFLTNDGGKSSRHSLSYILDGDTTLKENSAQTAGHSLSYILNNDQEESLVSTSSHWTKELGESSKNSYNTEERETEIKAACSKLSKNIFDIYETSLEQEVQADYMRRDQFRYCLKILQHFRTLETYFKIYHERNKGQTIKTNVIRSIIKSGGNGHLELTGNKLKLIIQRAKRIERLLNLANNNYNIFDAFPDLNITFFSANRMNTYNYERWLILVQTNNLVSADEGRRLYKEYKEKCKKERYEYLRNLYIGANRGNDLLENEINDEKDEEDEEDEERINLLF